MYKCLRTDIKIAYFKDLHCEVRGGGGNGTRQAGYIIILI